MELPFLCGSHACAGGGLEDSETLCDVVEVVCIRVSVVCAAAVDDSVEAWLDLLEGHVGGRGWRPWLGWSDGLVGGVEVNERGLGEAELVLGERLDVEAEEAVLQKPGWVSHEVEEWILEGEIVACLVDECFADGVLVAEMLDGARPCCVGLFASV